MTVLKKQPKQLLHAAYNFVALVIKVFTRAGQGENRICSCQSWTCWTEHHERGLKQPDLANPPSSEQPRGNPVKSSGSGRGNTFLKEQKRKFKKSHLSPGKKRKKKPQQTKPDETPGTAKTLVEIFYSAQPVSSDAALHGSPQRRKRLKQKENQTT